MATKAVSGTCYYNQNGGSWASPYENQIITGASGTTTYRAYFSLNLGIDAISSLSSATITIKDTTDYSGPGFLTIGLCDSTPKKAFTSSDFDVTLISNTRITRQTTNTITLGSAARNALKNRINSTIYICLLAGEGEYFEFQGTAQGTTDERPKLSIEYEAYTVCTAPTTITVPAYATPSGSFTISWSGASGGTNNPIASYQVYWTVGGTPTTSSYTGTKNVVSTSTSGSTTITLSNANRGAAVRCRIVTRGSAGSSYYSDMSSPGVIKVNRLPDEPSADIDGNITSVYYGQTVTFTLRPGASNDENQTTSVYYSTSASGEKKKISSSTWKPTITKNITYYFWTYDGYEFSSASTQKSIEKLQPVIHSLTSDLTPFRALNESGPSGSYFLGFVNAITPKIRGSSAGTIKWRIETTRRADVSESFTNSQNYTLADFTLSTTSETSMTPLNVDTAIEAKYNVEYSSSYKYYPWRIRCQLVDGAGDASEYKYFPADGKYYAVPGASNIDSFSNQNNISDITDTTHGHMYKIARFNIFDDDSIDNNYIRAVVTKSNDSTIVYPCTVSSETYTTTSNETTNYMRYILVTLNNEPGSGVGLNFTLSYGNSNITKTVTAQMTECLYPTFSGNLSYGMQSIKPFTDTGTFEIATASPFGSYTSLSDACDAYECDSDNIKVVLTRTGVTSESVIGAHGKTIRNPDELVLTMSISDVYQWGSLGLTAADYYGTYNYNAKIRITNRYGVEAKFESASSTNAFVFNELVSNVDFSAQCSIDGENWYTFNLGNTSNIGTQQPNSIQEGLYLRFTASCSAFSADAITFTLNKGTSAFLTTVSPAQARATGRTSQPVSVSLTTRITEDVTSSEAFSLQLSVSNNAGAVQSSSKKVGSLMHTAPTGFSLNSCTASSYSDIAFKASQTASGISSGTLNYYLFDTSTDITGVLSPTLDGTTVNDVTLLSSSSWEVKSISLHLQSVTEQDITTGVKLTNTKNFYTNYIVVYQLQPTIAYRKNHLGVNTDNLASNAVLDIHAITIIKNNTSETHNRIYFRGVNENFYLFVDEPVDISTTSTPNIIGNRGLAFDNNGTKVPVITIESNGVATFTGNVVGNIQGNIAGDVIGNLTGNVTGNLTGDVTGNVSGTASNITGTLGYAHGGTNATSLDNARQNFGFDFTKSVASGSSINFTVAANTHALIFSTGGNGSNTKCMWLINTAGGTTPTPTYAEVFNGGSTVTVSASANRFTVNNGTTATMYFGIIVLGGSIT